MTTLNDRPNTALLVIDVQRDVMKKAHDRDSVIANINTLVEKARSADVPVIWVQHSDDNLVPDTAGWEYVPELQRHESEPLVHKSYGDSFEGTDLEQLLAEHRVGHLVVSGASTDACVRSTLHGALVRGYDATLVEDAHHRGPERVGPAAQRRAGHRPHQCLLELGGLPGSQGRDRPNGRGRVRGEHLTKPSANTSS
jgi:nicotinamidase-related amidase